MGKGVGMAVSDCGSGTEMRQQMSRSPDPGTVGVLVIEIVRIFHDLDCSANGIGLGCAWGLWDIMGRHGAAG